MCKCPDRKLSQMYVGKAKDSLDLVDLNLVVLEVAAVFGRFLKYACTVDQAQEDTEVSLSLSLSLSLSHHQYC